MAALPALLAHILRLRIGVFNSVFRNYLAFWLAVDYQPSSMQARAIDLDRIH